MILNRLGKIKVCRSGNVGMHNLLILTREDDQFSHKITQAARLIEVSRDKPVVFAFYSNALFKTARYGLHFYYKAIERRIHILYGCCQTPDSLLHAYI